jgi:methionyl aminopeptidase
MIICIEPMLMTASDQYDIDPVNHWTVIAKNQQLTCHCEHMVLIKKDGCEVLTA